MSKYVRIQGRILGPFDDNAIADMFRHGKIGRFTEMSEDKRNWYKAGETQLFESRKKNKASSDSLELDSDDEGMRSGRKDGNAEWFYSVDGITGTGPFTAQELKDMLANGKIESDTLVWKEGVGAAPLSSVPELSCSSKAKTSLKRDENRQSNPNETDYDDEEEDDSIYCVGCGKSIPAGSKTCPKCGTRQSRDKSVKKTRPAKVRRCSQCDSPIDAGASRCPRCGGAPLEAENGSFAFTPMVIFLFIWIAGLICLAIWYFLLR